MEERNFVGLGDVRLDNRTNALMGSLVAAGTHSIRELSTTGAELKSYYRLFQNDRFTEESLIANLTRFCKAACFDKDVVCIQDTSEINLSAHKGRLRSDGTLGTTNAKNTTGYGFFMHPSLVLDAGNGAPLGICAIKVFNRPGTDAFQDKKARKTDRLPIEDKESYRWIQTSLDTVANLTGQVRSMTIVQDREGDIYEQFALLEGAGGELKNTENTTEQGYRAHLLVRARTNRVLNPNSEEGAPQKLFDYVAGQPLGGSYRVEIPARGRRKKRTAQLELRFCAVSLPRTGGCSKKLPAQLEMWIVEAREVGYKGKDPLLWRLLSTRSVENFEDAMQAVTWYSWRWTVEEVFRILKKGGFKAESSELERGGSVRKLCLLLLEAIVRLLLMRHAVRMVSPTEEELHLPQSCFTEEEVLFLDAYIPLLEGKTERQRNPYAKADLRHYVWPIARLGGWKGSENKGRTPGIVCLWKGLKAMNAAINGWRINRDVS